MDHRAPGHKATFGEGLSRRRLDGVAAVLRRGAGGAGRWISGIRGLKGSVRSEGRTILNRFGRTMEESNEVV